jgi:dTDP-4-amino-4,6-dideoxygalactose transaminase
MIITWPVITLYPNTSERLNTMAQRLAINGGDPAIREEFPGWPVWGEAELRAVREVVESGVWGVQGTRLPEFTKKFSDFQHVGYALPVANGSVAIETALEALGIGGGDEVVVPDYTFVATAAAPVRRGARAVPVDVDARTFCIDPVLAEEAVTDKTRAIIPVHFGGHPCDMTAIMKLAARYGLHVIEDCSHAHGAQWEGRYVGTFGEMGTFSLQASKTLNCGEGGVIVTDSERLYAICSAIHNAGRVVGSFDYNHYVSGTNYRMTELQAGILLAQMERLEEQCDRRDGNGRMLTALLEDIDGVTPQYRDPRVGRHGHYLFTFLLDADIPRDVFRRALKAEGVLVQREYPAIHSLECIRKKNMGAGDFPVSVRLADRSIWLYHETLLGTEDQITQVAEAVRKVLENRTELPGTDG